MGPALWSSGTVAMLSLHGISESDGGTLLEGGYWSRTTNPSRRRCVPRRCSHSVKLRNMRSRQRDLTAGGPEPHELL